ncbi:hypothetical protein [Poseidonocella sp. HB161398]|uniref:hypothetical protein n=1 Tax=Poseidonocella sp. HB161398 TaxID=2320855 RepID=UPI0011088B64|nr:hypothetical protein [Poseidonocella sp. HB161398]
MEKHSTLLAGLEVSKERHAVAVAGNGRDGDMRYPGEIGSDGAPVRWLAKTLACPGTRLHVRCEAGPSGYGLKRLTGTFGHGCAGIALSLSPRRPGALAKTSRRNAERLARLLRAGGLAQTLDAGSGP